MKLFTKEIDKKLFAQYSKGSDLSNQMVVAKIFNPYGRGTWYLINSDEDDPDYLWAIVDLFEVEVGSVSRNELESIKIKPFNLGLERDLSFSPKKAEEVFKGLLSGKTYAKGGITFRGLQKIVSKVFAKHDFQSGSEIKSSKVNKIKYAEAADEFLKQAGVEKGSLSKDTFSKLENENYHTFNEFLVINDYFEPSVADKQSYLKNAKEEPNFYLGADGIIGGKAIAAKVPSKSGKLKYDPSRDVVAIAIKDGVFNKMFTKGDFLGGAYQMESGGVLKDYNYVSPRNIIFARLKSGEDIKPVNGFYIRKNASGTVMTDAASKPIAKANVKSLKISIPRPILLTGSPSKSPKMMKFIGTFSGKDLLRPAMTFVQIKEGTIVATDAYKLIRIIDGSTFNEDKLVCEAAKCKTEKPEDQKFPIVSQVINPIDSEFSESYDMVDLYESLMQVRNDDLKNKLSRTLRVIELKLENQTIYFNITLLLECVKGCLLLGWKKAFISYSQGRRAIVFTQEKAKGRVSEVSLILLMPILGDSAFDKVTITAKMLLEQGGIMADGGEVFIPTTYLDYNPDYLVGTNTMSEMFADGGMMAKGGQIKSPYIVTFGFQGDDEYEIAKSKPIFAENEDEAAFMLKDQFESFEGIDCDIIRVKKMADGGAIPEDYHQMPDGSIMADSMHMANGGITYRDLSLEKPSIVNETKIESERFKIDEVDLFRKSKKTFSGSPTIRSSDDSVKIFREFWDEQSLTIFESFNVMLLNQANKIVGLYQHSKGGVTGTVADPEMVVLSAVKSLAKGVIISHNHPSGNLTPSKADIEMTNKIKNALKFLDIRLLDSIIITEKAYYSFANEGKMAQGGGIGRFPSSQYKWDANHPYQFTIYFKNGEKEFTDWYDLKSANEMKAILNNDKVVYKLFYSKDGINLEETPAKFAKGGKIREFDDVLIISKNKLGMVEAIADNIYYVTTPFGESFEAALDDLQKVKSFAKGGKLEILQAETFNTIVSDVRQKTELSRAEIYSLIEDFETKIALKDNKANSKFAKGGAMEHMVFKGDKVLAIHRNMVIVESDLGQINVLDLSTEPIARRISIESITGKNTLQAAREQIDYLVSRKPKTMAVGGSLQGHGFEVGDLIVEDLGGYIRVVSEDGKDFFITLKTGDRETEAPLPFKHGGKVKHSDVTRLATKTNEAGDEVVDLTEFYEGGGNVPKVFDVPAQFLDSEGKRKNDRETIKRLTDFVLTLPQTKEIYYNDQLGDYTPSRKKLHAEIINKFKKEVVCINNDKPIAIFMGGSPASGKSSFLRKYSPFLLKEEILKIDADEIRAMLPEYEGWNACQTHLETKDIVNILLSNKNIGIPCDFDIIYDGTMNSVKSYIPLMDILRKRGYKIFIVFMDNVPKDVIIKRALDRYKSSGRFVPLEVIEDFFSKGKTAFNELKKDVDGYMLIDGSSQDYKVIEEGGMKLPRDREYSKLGTKIKASDIPTSYKKGGLSKLY